MVVKYEWNEACPCRSTDKGKHEDCEFGFHKGFIATIAKLGPSRFQVVPKRPLMLVCCLARLGTTARQIVLDSALRVARGASLTFSTCSLMSLTFGCKSRIK